MRNIKGRVPPGTSRALITRAAFRSYLSSQLVRVGTAKGAWAAGAMRLGLKKLQKWITRSDDGGQATRTGRTGKVSWTLAADPAHVAKSNVLGERGAARALKSQERNIRKFFEQRIKGDMKKAARKLNT